VHRGGARHAGAGFRDGPHHDCGEAPKGQPVCGLYRLEETVRSYSLAF
jgi:hypothetical protein